LKTVLHSSLSLLPSLEWPKSLTFSRGRPRGTSKALDSYTQTLLSTAWRGVIWTMTMTIFQTAMTSALSTLTSSSPVKWCRSALVNLPWTSSWRLSEKRVFHICTEMARKTRTRSCISQEGLTSWSPENEWDESSNKGPNESSSSKRTPCSLSLTDTENTVPNTSPDPKWLERDTEPKTENSTLSTNDCRRREKRLMTEPLRPETLS
jgi:hypothetical protein